MRVTSVDIYASNSTNSITLSFKDPTNQNRFNVKSILGLDADEILTKFAKVSSLSAEKYYDFFMKQRDIVVQVTLNPDYSQGQTPSTLRDELYRLIASSRTGAVEIRFKDGANTVAAISGFVTKLEADLFSKVPEVQLSITCSDGLLKAPTEVNIPVVSLDPEDTVVVDNASTAPHGFRFGVRFTSYIPDFSIQDLASPTWAFEINLTGSALEEFRTNDELHFSSEQNNRYLTLLRGLSVYHVVDRIVPTSVWPVLFPGENNFRLSMHAEWDYISHYPTYWGV